MSYYDTAGNLIMTPMLRCPKDCGLTGGCSACMPKGHGLRRVTVPSGSGVRGELNEFGIDEKEFYRKTLHSKLLCDDKDCDICNP